MRRTTGALMAQNGQTDLSTGMGAQLVDIWLRIRAPIVAPIVQMAINLCLVMVVLMFIERVYLCSVVVVGKCLRWKPEKRYKFVSIKDDAELANSNYPKVLIQIPMFNEKEVYQLSIGAVCGLSWPSDRIVIQVLDDSTDSIVKEMVQMECQRWASKGVNIRYEIRDNRNGYKAGALKEGMKRSYVRDCDYVAIFDADFQPDPEFLWRTVPFLMHNPELGLVQARWKFGTAGVWRVSALKEAGGWKDRTTVEDMDLAIRASLKGWKFVFLNDLSVKNELPSTFKAFRYQQHRWSAGPANLFRKIFVDVVSNKKVDVWKKIHILYGFFVVRKIGAHIVTFVFYCFLIPTSVLVPEVHLPKWGAIYMPSAITILNALWTLRSLHLLVFWILFENAMSLHRTKGTFVGLLDLGRVNEWIVTEKLGDALKSKLAKLGKRGRMRFGERLHVLEVLAGLYIFFCAVYDFYFGHNHFYIYLFLQAAAFLIMGFGYIGTFVPT